MPHCVDPKDGPIIGDLLEQIQAEWMVDLFCTARRASMSIGLCLRCWNNERARHEVFLARSLYGAAVE